MQLPLAHILIRVYALKSYTNWEIHAPESYNIYFHTLFLSVGEWKSETNRIKFFTAHLSVVELSWGLRFHGTCVWATRNLSPCSSTHTLPCPPYLPSPQPVGSIPHAPWFLLASGMFCYLLSTFSLIKAPSPEGICEMRSVPANSPWEAKMLKLFLLFLKKYMLFGMENGLPLSLWACCSGIFC